MLGRDIIDAQHAKPNEFVMSKDNDDYIKRVGKLEFDLTYNRTNLKIKQLELMFKVYFLILYLLCFLLTYSLANLLESKKALAYHTRINAEARQEFTLNIYKSERLKLGKNLDTQSEIAMNSKQELLFQDNVIEVSRTIEALEPIVILNIFLFGLGVLPIALIWLSLKMYNIKIIYNRN